MSRSEIAVDKFKEGYNCAQSVLYSFSDKLNISKDLALKISSGLGAGMGRKQEVCGAISGGILVLGLIYGQGENEEKQKKETAYSKVRELMDEFEKKFNTVNCKELLNGCELLTPEGQEKYRSDNMFKKCLEYVDYTVKILEEIIMKV